MENNIDLIRKKVLEVKKNCLLVKENLPIDKQLDAQIKVSDYILSFIDSLQEEPKDPCKDHVSEELETELDSYIKDNFTIDKEQLDRFGLDEKDYMYSMDKSDMLAMVRHFTELQHKKDVVITEDLIATAFANGMADMKQRMIKYAVVGGCFVDNLWHDASEKPERDDLLIETNDGKIIHRQSINNYGMVKRWAYTSDLLNLDNSCNFGKNLQEEPIIKETNMYIFITQKIVDYIEEHKVFFENTIPTIGEKWFIEREHTYPNVNRGNPVVEVINDKGEWMRLPKDIVEIFEETKDRCKGCNNVKGCVTCADGSEWAHYEEPVSEDKLVGLCNAFHLALDDNKSVSDDLDTEIQKYKDAYIEIINNHLVMAEEGIDIIARHFANWQSNKIRIEYEKNRG